MKKIPTITLLVFALLVITLVSCVNLDVTVRLYLLLFSLVLATTHVLFSEFCRFEINFNSSPWVFIFSFGFLYFCFPLISFFLLKDQFPNVADRRLFLSTPSPDAVFEIWSVTIYFFLGLLVVYFFNTKVAKNETPSPRSIEPTNLLLNLVLIILIFRMGIVQAYTNTYPALLFAKATELIPYIYVAGAAASRSKFHICIAFTLISFLAFSFMEGEVRRTRLFLMVCAGLIGYFSTRSLKYASLIMFVSAVSITAVFLLGGYYQTNILGENVLHASNEFQSIFANAIDIGQRYFVHSTRMFAVASDFIILNPVATLMQTPKLNLSDFYVDLMGRSGQGIGYGFGLVAQINMGFGVWDALIRGVITGMCLVYVERLLIKSDDWLHFVAGLMSCFLVYHIFRAQLGHYFFMLVFRLLPAITMIYCLEFLTKKGIQCLKR